MNLDTQSLQPIINFIWTVADDVLINKYLENQYQDVILPMTVLRRLDLALEPTKDKVLKTHNEFKSKMDNLDGLLTSETHGSGLAFYNTSPYTMKMLLNDPKNIDSNFLDYLNGYSENVQDIISKFKFRNQLETLENGGITFSLIEKFCNPKVELRPEKISPMAMGYMFEDLIRRFNEKTNAAAGRHFTPREIIELMTHLVYLPVKDKIQNGTFLVYDPCAGSGAMLTQSKKYATNPEGEVKSKATFHLYGQENTGEMYATCKSDMLLKNEDPEKIKFGSTLSEYNFEPNLKFDFMLTNPPYGVSWKQDIENLNTGEGKKIEITDRRFNLPLKNKNGDLEEKCLTSRQNDGQLMFVLHMLSKMKETTFGSRIGTVHNRSALITGKAGQGESDIRKYIIENDLLEAVISLPTDIFYNTGLPTYILIFTNRKSNKRKGRVQLIDASHLYKVRNKSLGEKKKDLTVKQIDEITKWYLDDGLSENSKFFDNETFFYNEITIQQPLRDENEEIVYDSKNKPVSDKALKFNQKVPINLDPEKYYNEQVKPSLPDSWLDVNKTKVGCEIQFEKLMFKYKPEIKSEEIVKKIHSIESEIKSSIEELMLIDSKVDIYNSFLNTELDWINKIPVGWKQYKNKELFEERIERGGLASELLSVTQDRGVIRQNEDNKKDSSNEDKSKYKRVYKGDLVYNKMRMWQGAVGYSNYNGIVSPAYVVLKPKLKTYSKFFYYLFKTEDYIQQSKRYSYGLCDDMNSLRYEDFANMTSIAPDFQRQKEIVENFERIITTQKYLAKKQKELTTLLKPVFQGKISI